MLYKYIAFASTGEQIAGSIDAANEQVAERTLWDWQYKIVSLRAARPRPRLDQVIPSLFGVKAREIITFSRQLATLAESGIALLPAIELLSGQNRGPFARVLKEIARDIKNGSPFSTAVAAQGKIFPPIYSRLLEVGERTGNLETVLRQAAVHIEKEQAIIKKVRGAMAYPAFISVLAVVVVGLLITTALPPLVSLFDEFGTQLPLPTRILMGVSAFGTAYKMHMLIGAIAVAVGIGFYLQRPAGKRQLDFLTARLPLLGPINVQANVSRISRTMSMLLKAGVSLSNIMELVLQTTQNQIVREELTGVRDELLRGDGLAKPIAKRKLFPTMFSQIVAVGEETGSLDANLEMLAEFYANEVDEKVNALTGMIQPAMTLVIGVGVAFIAVSIIMPMYSIMGSIK